MLLTTDQDPPAPIHRIPPEILEIIFHLRLRPLNVFSYYAQLYELVLVCRRWSGVVMESARFWFLLKRFGPTPHWGVILTRSKTHPLVISNHQVGNEPKDSALFKQVHRWKSAWIYIPYSGTPVALLVPGGLCTEPARLIRKFTCIVPDGSRTMALPNLFGGQAPKLRRLQLDRCCLDFASPLFQQLLHLQLANITTEGVALPAFVRILGNWKSLASLSLGGCKFDTLSDDVELAPEREEATPPALKTLLIHGLSPEDTVKILDLVNTPCCTRLGIEYPEGHPPRHIPLPISASCRAVMPTLRRIIASADRITITLKYEDDSPTLKIPTLSEGGTTFKLEIPGIETQVNALLFLASDWDLDITTVPATVLVSWPDTRVDDLIALGLALEYLQSTTKLIFHQCNPTVIASSLTTLSSPYIVQEPFGWICPRLENLLFMDCEDLSVGVVLRMLDHRYHRQHRPPKYYDPEKEGVSPGQRPERLKLLVLEGADCDPETLESITRVAGPQTRVVLDPDSESSYSDFVIPNSDDDLDLYAEESEDEDADW